MKELLWNTFSQSVLYLQLHSLPELLLLQVIAVLLQAQVKNKVADVFLPHFSFFKSNMKSWCIFRCQDWPSWSILSYWWYKNMISCVSKPNLQISISKRWLWFNNVFSSLIRIQICLISCKPQLVLKFPESWRVNVDKSIGISNVTGGLWLLCDKLFAHKKDIWLQL